MTNSIKCKCGKDFDTVYYYRLHQQTCEYSTFVCECGAKYNNIKSLNSHQNRCKTVNKIPLYKIQKDKIADDKKYISSNQELYLFLKKYHTNISHMNGNNFSEKVKKFSGIDIPEFDKMEDLFYYLTGKQSYCEICENKCRLISFTSGLFFQFCSDDCHMKWRSKRQSENNTIHRLKDRKKWSENVSRRLKAAIAEGRFTPHVSNSWCHSRRKVVIKDKVVYVRSSWEEKFLLANPSFSYEKTRIPYIDTHGKKRTYIVDFTDERGNLYEIKPSSKIGECNEKTLSAIEYAKENGVKFTMITEKDFLFYENKKNTKD